MVSSKNLQNEHEHHKNLKKMKNYMWKKQDIIQSFVMEETCAQIKMCKPKIKII